LAKRLLASQERLCPK